MCPRRSTTLKGIKMNDERPTLERIMQVASGGWALAILAAAARHSVFTHVEAGADTVEALAKKAGISARGAGTLLDGLVGLGFLTLSAGRYRNAPDAAEFLVEGKASYFGGFPKVQLAEFPELLALPISVNCPSQRCSWSASLLCTSAWPELSMRPLTDSPRESGRGKCAVSDRDADGNSTRRGAGGL